MIVKSEEKRNKPWIKIHNANTKISNKFKENIKYF